MSLPITPARLAAVYECLRAFPPYNRMKLPEASWIKFQVLRTRVFHGDYTRYIGTDEHILRVSATTHAQFGSLAATVGHEAIHLHQAVAKTETANTQHNAEFKRLAARACRIFGWDLGQFL